MANILREEDRARIDRALRVRFVIVGALALALAGALSTLALIPAYIQTHALFASLERAAEEDAAQRAEGGREEAEELRRAKRLAESVRDVSARHRRLVSLLDAVLDERPAAVAVTGIQYDIRSGGTITLSGSSSDRNTVNEYRQRLMQSGFFEDVSVPVAALLGTAGGRFTMTLTITGEEL
ncbi:hypothetical protein COU20_01695 [Candidatus Kaiserbacteria bacterium CG10_big_fil_rev_8_21_14_0_10_59_10]|uniref:PilN domain-containing protein n=1 Tax=Candidatus Kaiserbacteria bacterium CG10_big_fil_rev_8_21_14_0_10_59_10 TaxID=1974612 RepID=A0A2H0U7V0_9BACT|nr:MAG: hypothetical protein COU20_01695 [Candidatus Kaiserbacteria bacterium CG10_big_fil_rev_8_21_14_0_10_59_10]